MVSPDLTSRRQSISQLSQLPFLKAIKTRVKPIFLIERMPRKRHAKVKRKLIIEIDKESLLRNPEVVDEAQAVAP